MKTMALIAMLLILLTSCAAPPSVSQQPSETVTPADFQDEIVLKDSVLQVGEKSYITENMELSPYGFQFTKIIFPTGSNVRYTSFWVNDENTMSCALYGYVNNTSETETVDLSTLSCSFTDKSGTEYDSTLLYVDYETQQMSSEKYSIIQPGETGQFLCAADVPKELLLTKSSFNYVITDGNIKLTIPIEWEGREEVEIGSVVSGSQSDVEILAVDWTENIEPSNRGTVSTVIKGESGRLFIRVLAKISNTGGGTTNELHNTVKFQFANGFFLEKLDHIYETDEGSKLFIGGDGKVGNSVLSDDMIGALDIEKGESALIDYYVLLPETIAKYYTNLEVTIDEIKYTLELPPLLQEQQ